MNRRAVDDLLAPAFCAASDISPTTIVADHDGQGPIEFRRLLTDKAFASAIDFVDYTTIPPGSKIGRHRHSSNEEIYFIVDGCPLVQVESEQRRLERGDVSIVRSNESHELINDTTEPVTIFVIQVAL